MSKMKNAQFGDLQKEAHELLLGKRLFSTSSNPSSSFFYTIHHVMQWCLESDLEVKFTPMRGKVRCLILPNSNNTFGLAIDNITKATADTWYNALLRCAIDVSKKMRK